MSDVSLASGFFKPKEQMREDLEFLGVGLKILIWSDISSPVFWDFGPRILVKQITSLFQTLAYIGKRTVSQTR